MKSGAVISEDQIYRYNLYRDWHNESSGDAKRIMVFIGLNPSTADATHDDPTIRRCIGFAKDWGFNALYMLNLFAFRSTEPELLKFAKDPIGPENNKYLTTLGPFVPLVIAAWGVHGTYLGRDREVKKLFPKLYHLGLTKDGHPRHPLYLKKETKPELWV